MHSRICLRLAPPAKMRARLFAAAASALLAAAVSPPAMTGRLRPRELPASAFVGAPRAAPAAAGAAATATPPLRFGYYADNLTATPWQTLHQAGSVADAAAAFAATGVPSLLLIDVFTSAPKRMVLQDGWRAQLSALAASAAPLFASGAVIGYNLGDELIWNCLAPVNLTLVADAVRGVCPVGSCIVWYNEAAVFHTPDFTDSCGNGVVDYAIPRALDWFSVDIYHVDGLVAGWVDTFVRGFYDAWVFPNLTDTQSVALVPGSFGSNVNHYPNGTFVCDVMCYDLMISHDAVDFAAWAREENSRVAAVLPWNWQGCPSCNGSRWTPPHTCCMDELGTDVMPMAAAAWRTLFGPAD